jgi:uncharacterized damage-inducible protein DinB
MKELLLQYAQYNVWANKLMIDVLVKLEDGAAEQELVSSFPSLLKTVTHTWSAESIWLQRLLLVEHPVWQEGDFNGTIGDACKEWQAASAGLIQFVEKQYDDKALQHVLQFYDRQKNSHKMPVYQVLQHVFNHSTYHRGQLVTMLRQVGQTKIPGTDFITFARLK